ncbi:MAG: hypothetical protein IT383_21605 [Deltaproteobacteria bacterium]|nr:hypothetical protein [Deltaproteobacteria bacterium]
MGARFFLVVVVLLALLGCETITKGAAACVAVPVVLCCWNPGHAAHADAGPEPHLDSTPSEAAPR